MITASLVVFKTKHDELRRILKCCIECSIDKVYIVDNSPTNELFSIVSEYETDKLDYIYGQGNVGFGHANNIGIRKAILQKSKFHIILNPDIFFSVESFEKMTQFMETHDDIGMMAPTLVYPDGRPQVTAMMLPTPYDMFGRRLLPKIFVDRINEHYELKKCDLTKAREIPNICGCFMYCRTEVLQKAGLFDERFFMYFEDFDLVRRVHNVAKVVFYPDAFVVHAHAAEHRRNKFLLKQSIKSAIQYFNKWGWLFDSDRRKWNKAVFKHDSIIKEK